MRMQASQATQPTQQSLRDDKDLDAVFARMDQLALLEEQETADAGGDADDRGLDAEGTGEVHETHTHTCTYARILRHTEGADDSGQ